LSIKIIEYALTFQYSNDRLLIMNKEAIKIDFLPRLKDPLFIAGFEGWGNALDISRGMVDYLIQKLEARLFGKINPDLFYRFDENRPLVEIKNGFLEELQPPESSFHVAKGSGRDIVILKAVEPSLHWFQYVETILSLCSKLGIRTLVSLGSMYDNVLHTDKVVSAIASSNDLLASLEKINVKPINYRGPSAIHSTIHSMAQKQGFDCVSLWCHCPYYLQGTTHFGLLSHLGGLLSSWGGFSLDTDELEATWQELSRQIQGLIEKNPELQGMLEELRKAKGRGTLSGTQKGKKVIRLEDFIKPK